MTILQSSKWQYRVVTAPKGRFATQARLVASRHDAESWRCLSTFETVDEAAQSIKRQIEEDDFAHQVVEVEV
jgi:hypothetical protein